MDRRIMILDFLLFLTVRMLDKWFRYVVILDFLVLIFVGQGATFYPPERPRGGYDKFGLGGKKNKL